MSALLRCCRHTVTRWLVYNLVLGLVRLVRYLLVSNLAQRHVTSQAYHGLGGFENDHTGVLLDTATITCSGWWGWGLGMLRCCDHLRGWGHPILPSRTCVRECTCACGSGGGVGGGGGKDSVDSKHGGRYIEDAMSSLGQERLGCGPGWVSTCAAENKRTRATEWSGQQFPAGC